MVAKKSRPVKVSEEIKTWVVDRDLKQGDRLPNEAEMIAIFGVSKGTVREALRILEAEGLISTRTGPGGGSFVNKVTVEHAKSLLANYFYFEQLSLSDFYQLRKILEPELAANLAGKLTEEQLNELDALTASLPEPATSAQEEKEQHIASLRNVMSHNGWVRVNRHHHITVPPMKRVIHPGAHACHADDHEPGHTEVERAVLFQRR